MFPTQATLENRNVTEAGQPDYEEGVTVCEGATVDKPPYALRSFKGDRNVNSGSTPGSSFFALATKKSGKENQVFT